MLEIVSVLKRIAEALEIIAESLSNKKKTVKKESEEK